MNDNPCNVENRTIFCRDNLDILQGINPECIDLIYLDPPFNKNKKFTASIGSSAEGAEFEDIFREEKIKEEWLKTIQEDHPEIYHYLNGIRGVGKSYNFAYLAYMIIRLMECYRVLKPTGSLYLHCDPTMSHYLKIALDSIFGESCFGNEIIWHYGKMSNSKRNFPNNHDIIFRYTKSEKFVFHPQKQDESEYRTRYQQFLTGNQVLWGSVKNKTDKLVQSRARNIERKLERSLQDEDVLFDFDKEFKIQSDVIYVPIIKGNSAERTGYPTQKPLALLERVISASSNEGDTVLDPFCGCATTCVAAERLNRNWIGIDISIKAFEMVNERLTKEIASPHDLLKYQNSINLQTNPPRRSDSGDEHMEKKFVYAISHYKYPGEYKVGIAKNPKARLNQYQTSDPERAYKLEFEYETPWFRQTEQHIHNKFDNRHEWMNGALKSIIHEIKNYKPA